MARARNGNAIQSKIQMTIYGEPFTGKSTMASQFAYMKNPDGSPFKVLYLDPESGSIDDYLGTMKANGVNPANIWIVYTQSLTEVLDYISRATNNEDFYEIDDDGNETDTVVLDGDGKPFRPDAIVVDGTSVLNLTTKQGIIEFSKKRANVKADIAGLIGDARLVKVDGAGLELKDYQTINFKGQDLILALNASGKHYIVTARETDEKEQRIIDGKKESVSTGRKIPEGFKGMQYNCKTCIRMYRDPDDYDTVKAFVEKDRTGVHSAGEILEDPSLIDWQEVINKTANNAHVVIKNGLSHAKDVSSAYDDKTLEFEIRKSAITQNVKYCFYDTLKSDIADTGDWAAFKITVTKLTELAKQLKIFMYGSIQLSDEANTILPDELTSSQIANCKQIKHILHTLVLYKEIPHSMFHRYGYLYNDADWGDPVVRDLDVNKRYYIGNVDKNRFGQKKKLLFELNLDTNVWVELGEAVKK